MLVIAGCFGYFILKALTVHDHDRRRIPYIWPEYSMISDNNDLGLALNMTLPLFYFLAQQPRRWARWLCESVRNYDPGYLLHLLARSPGGTDHGPDPNAAAVEAADLAIS